jgi:hypothetical protein
MSSINALRQTVGDFGEQRTHYSALQGLVESRIWVLHTFRIEQEIHVIVHSKNQQKLTVKNAQKPQINW